MGTIFLHEIAGTAILLLLGVGVVANVVLTKTKGNGGGWLLISFGWGLGVFAGVYVAAATGAHLNPAVTVGLLVSGAEEYAPGIAVTLGTTLAYFAAQLIGAGELTTLIVTEVDRIAARRLQTYLDGRTAAGRVDAEGDADARTRRAPDPGAMTQEEAHQILGLQSGATLQQIRTAHRTLMKRLHPDQGGTAEQAARVNAARDRLNNRHR